MTAAVLGPKIDGQNKRAYFTAWLRRAIGTPCLYCEGPLTLENVSLDHKRAFGSSLRRLPGPATRLERLLLDRIENLQLICKLCNSTKSDLDADEFEALLEFLKDRPRLKEKLFRRLRRAGAIAMAKSAGRRFVA